MANPNDGTTSGPPGEVTELLARAVSGDGKAVDEALSILYAELRAVAGAHIRQERPDHTLQPTALVHEAYLRIRNRSRIQWKDRAHFVAAASRVMRQVLVDYARAHRAEKRGGNRERVPLESLPIAGGTPGVDLIALDRALVALGTNDPRRLQVVEILYFGGLSTTEAARVLDVSKRTVERDWRYARAWLLRALSEADE